MTRNRLLWVVALGAAVLLTSVGVVYAKYSSRSHFVELQQLRLRQDRLDEQWGRLQLEQSTWATHGRIESVARNKLGMALPGDDEVVIVRP